LKPRAVLFLASPHGIGRFVIGQRPEFLGHDRARAQLIVSKASKHLEAIAGEKHNLESLIEEYIGVR
jgi:hypothetical protein